MKIELVRQVNLAEDGAKGADNDPRTERDDQRLEKLRADAKVAEAERRATGVEQTLETEKGERASEKAKLERQVEKESRRGKKAVETLAEAVANQGGLSDSEKAELYKAKEILQKAVTAANTRADNVDGALLRMKQELEEARAQIRVQPEKELTYSMAQDDNAKAVAKRMDLPCDVFERANPRAKPQGWTQLPPGFRLTVPLSEW